MQADNTSSTEKTDRKPYKQKDKGIYERVGKVLQTIRERQGLKAAQVANDRISPTIVAKMERGEALTLDNLSTIARQLKTNLAAIFAEADQIRETTGVANYSITIKDTRTGVRVKSVTADGKPFVLTCEPSEYYKDGGDVGAVVEAVRVSLAKGCVALPQGWEIEFVEEADAETAVPTDAEPDACAECDGEGCPACDDDGDLFGR
jgi:transcriptional regulator with XRE-family HTH domain